MTAVLDLLDRGTVVEWATIVQAIHGDPFGGFVKQLETALCQTYLYGTSRLFLTIIARARGEQEDSNSFPLPSELVP